MVTSLVERTLGSIDPVKVKLSPPSKLREVDGKMLVTVQSMCSATS